jgi:elongator complex protein 3
VGLTVETRPDHVSEEEVLRIRRLGGTKVQIGIQSLSDRLLSLNRRGHDVAATRRALRLLRAAGFKIHAHWMPNLRGATPEADVADFAHLFEDVDFRPYEIKIYPCSLLESAELMAYYERGEWRPYGEEELLAVLMASLVRTPPYCRITRVIRDFSADDIVAGSKVTNLREVAERALHRQGGVCRDIRTREIRESSFRAEALDLSEVAYETSIGDEVFLQYVTPDDRLVAFLRLSLPRQASFARELGESAIIREVHVYGASLPLSRRKEGRAQHLGLGQKLVERACERAAAAGYADLAVISAVGTRAYYRTLGFRDGFLYQHRRLAAPGGS